MSDTGKNYHSEYEASFLLPKKPIDSENRFNESSITFKNDDNLDNLIPEPKRSQKKKKLVDSTVENFFRNSVEDELLRDEMVTKTTTKTQVVKKKTKKKSSETVDNPNTSLKVKIKAKSGTSVNVSNI